MISDRAWEAIRDGYDLQVHVAPDVIERRIAGRSGAKIVWMPTVDAANEIAGRVDGPSTKAPLLCKNSAGSLQERNSATGQTHSHPQHDGNQCG